jgi:hypothetical protein
VRELWFHRADAGALSYHQSSPPQRTLCMDRSNLHLTRVAFLNETGCAWEFF